ncbi:MULTISPECIES: hypothetical protein [Acinetobacter]|uniref:Uncharacterized protein n=1 Tax=Acinetobacter dispersus TaxID=70348 RepID=N9LM49_9GAMM|nr:MULTISPECIES: hypothetical protein [Acinetobacter]ENW97347.1 hypothetical protein F904_00185 [Acinetobacter dispersus]
MKWLVIAAILFIVILLICRLLIGTHNEWDREKREIEENDSEGIKQTKLWYSLNRDTVVSGRFTVGKKHRITYRPKLE